MAVARSSFDDSAICYILPVLWMTSCFHNEVNGPETNVCLIQLAGSGTGGEVCHLQPHLVITDYETQHY